MASLSSTDDPAVSGWRRLACAVMLKAIDDARDGDPLVRAWLAGEGARWLAVALDLDPNSPGRFAVGLPRPMVEQLTLPGCWEG